MVCFTRQQKKVLAFSLLEILLVIAIMSVLAGIILFTLNPAERINLANEAKAVANTKDIEKALRAYILDNGGNTPTGFSTITQSGIYDVCKYGQTTGCINLDSVVSAGYMANIPVDSRNSAIYTTGYKVDYNVSSKNISIYNKEMYDQKIKYCAPGDNCRGPIVEWLFEQGSGITALDTGGNNNHGTLINGPVWVDGKSGKALSFDGVDDFINTGYKVQSGARSYFFWVKYNSLTGPGGYSLSGTQQVGAYTYSGIINGGQGYYYAGNNGGTYNYTFSVDQWYHVGFTMDGVNATKLYVNGRQVDTKTYSADNTATADFLIGKVAGSHNINGVIDQVRVYNYLRTPAQIAWEYNQGLPILHLKFDDSSVGTGQTKIDSSESSYNGTTNSSNGTGMDCSVAGKYGSACEFDGIDDYISFASLPKPTLPLTISYWVNPTSNSPIGIYDSAPGIGDVLRNYPHGYIEWWSASPNVVLGLTANQWQHKAIIYKYENGNRKIEYYKNGLLINTATGSTSSNYSWTTFRLGNINGGSAGWYSGKLDEFRIYNYPLTQAQVMQVMQGV